MKIRSTLLVLVTIFTLAALQAPEFATGTIHKQLTPAPKMDGLKFSLDAHFTETYRSKGWVQSYGVVKVHNDSRRKLMITCTVVLKTGGIAIGVDKVDLLVPG